MEVGQGVGGTERRKVEGAGSIIIKKRFGD